MQRLLVTLNGDLDAKQQVEREDLFVYQAVTTNFCVGGQSRTNFPTYSWNCQSVQH